MPYENVIQALGGGGLTASDYAGLTPEQIQAVAQHGQNDRKLLSGIVSDMRQQDLAEEKQAFDEMHSNRMFQVMQNQEAREQFKMLVNGGMEMAKVGLEKKRLGLEAQRTASQLKKDDMEMRGLDAEYEQTMLQHDMLQKMTTKFVEVPGMADADGKPAKMSVGEAYAAGMLPTLLKAHATKFAAGGSGKSKQVELREYMGSKAKELGAPEAFVKVIELMGPEALKNLGPGTAASILSKNDPMFNMDDAATQKKKVAQFMEFGSMFGVSMMADLADKTTTASPEVSGESVPTAYTPEELQKLLEE